MVFLLVGIKNQKVIHYSNKGTGIKSFTAQLIFFGVYYRDVQIQIPLFSTIDFFFNIKKMRNKKTSERDKDNKDHHYVIYGSCERKKKFES